MSVKTKSKKKANRKPRMSPVVAKLKKNNAKKKVLMARLKKCKQKQLLLQKFMQQANGTDLTYKEWLEINGFYWVDTADMLGGFAATNLPKKIHGEMYDTSSASGYSNAYALEDSILRQFQLHTGLAPNQKSSADGNPLNTWFTESYIADLSLFGSDDVDDAQEYSEYLQEEFDAIEILHDHAERYEDQLADLLTDTEFDYYYGREINQGQYSNASGWRERRAKRKAKREREQKARQEARAARRAKRKENRSDRKQRKKETRASRKEKRKERRAKRKAEGKGLFRKIWKGFKKFNPLGVVARNGALVGIRMNVFGFATRMAPALVSDKRFKADSVAKAKPAYKKLLKSWEKLGGKPSAMRQAILKGWKKKPFLAKNKKGKTSSANGTYEFEIVTPTRSDQVNELTSNFEPATAGIVSAGLGVIAALLGLLKKNDVDKDPYMEGEAPVEYEDALRAGIVEEEIPYDPDDPVLDEDGNWIDPTTGDIVDPETGEIIDKTILGIPQVPFIIGSVVLGAAVIYISYKAITKNKPS